MQPQAFGVGHRIQRKSVLCRTRHSEEVRPRTAAITRCDPCNVLPSARVRPRAVISAAVTCAVTTLTEGYSLKMVRWGRAMSSAGSCELATW